MENRDTATVIVTSLLLVPWLGRVVAAAVGAWRGLRERQNNRRRSSLGPQINGQIGDEVVVNTPYRSRL
jgi:hypothetical protein